jgi:hypothetical protein
LRLLQPTPSPYTCQDMEGATDLEERSKLEANVFACIMPAIDATRRVYERRHGFTSEENNLKSNLAMLLSGLGSIILIWPLPKEAFDAEILLLMTHIFEDLEGTLEPLHHSGKSNPISEWALRHVSLAFHAVVDVATM